MPGRLWLPRLSTATMSPGRSSGMRTWSTQAWKATPLIGPSSTMGATMPELRRAATKIVVFQWPCGMAARSRSPRGDRPRVRAMFVEAQVSPMNTRRSGSRSNWPSNHSQRCVRMSGRSRSPACAVFFARDPVPVEEAPDRANARWHAGPGELRLDLRQRDVRPLLKEVEDTRRMSLDACRPAIAAESPRRNRSGPPRYATPADCARGAHTEPQRSLAAGRP